MDLRRLYGTTILAVNRGEEYLPNPGGDYTIQAEDSLIMIGKADEIRKASKLLGPSHIKKTSA